MCNVAGCGAFLVETNPAVASCQHICNMTSTSLSCCLSISKKRKNAEHERYRTSFVVILLTCTRTIIIKTLSLPIIAVFSSTLKLRNNAFRVYNTIQYNSIQYNTIQYNTIQFNSIQYNTIQYNTIQYSTV